MGNGKGKWGGGEFEPLENGYKGPPRAYFGKSRPIIHMVKVIKRMDFIQKVNPFFFGFPICTLLVKK